jgi:F-type H+-transporting ATPase subunit b
MFQADTGLMFWTITSFLIMVFLLYKFVFPPLNSVIKQRRVAIEDRIEQAKQVQAEAESLLKKYRDQMMESEKKTLEMLEDARRKSEAVKEESIRRAQKEAFQIIDDTRKDIEHFKKKALADMKNDIADIVVDVSEKLLKKGLDAKDHIKLVESSIKELEKNVNRKVSA